MLCEAAHPGLFRALYCFEPPTPMGPHPHMLAASARRRQRAFPSREEALRRLAGKPPFNRVTRRALESYVREGLRRDAAQYVWKCDPGDEARVYLTGLKSNVAEAARRGRLDLHCPVVLAAGTAAPLAGRCEKFAVGPSGRHGAEGLRPKPSISVRRT